MNFLFPIFLFCPDRELQSEAISRSNGTASRAFHVVSVYPVMSREVTDEVEESDHIQVFVYRTASQREANYFIGARASRASAAGGKHWSAGCRWISVRRPMNTKFLSKFNLHITTYIDAHIDAIGT